MSKKVDTIQFSCPKCHRVMELAANGNYYEGKCQCGEIWQVPKSYPVAQGRGDGPPTELRALEQALEQAYQDFYSKGREPGLLDARSLWQRIMAKYQAYRKTMTLGKES